MPHSMEYMSTITYTNAATRVSHSASRVRAGSAPTSPDCLGFPPYAATSYSHMGLNSITPAEKIGIGIPGSNKLLTLIRCAAASRSGSSDVPAPGLSHMD